MSQQPYRMWTADHFNDKNHKYSVYAVIPMMLGLNPANTNKSTTSCFLWGNASDTWVDIFTE